MKIKSTTHPNAIVYKYNNSRVIFQVNEEGFIIVITKKTYNH